MNPHNLQNHYCDAFRTVEGFEFFLYSFPEDRSEVDLSGLEDGLYVTRELAAEPASRFQLGTTEKNIAAAKIILEKDFGKLETLIESDLVWGSIQNIKMKVKDLRKKFYDLEWIMGEYSKLVSPSPEFLQATTTIIESRTRFDACLQRIEERIKDIEEEDRLLYQSLPIRSERNLKGVTSLIRAFSTLPYNEEVRALKDLVVKGNERWLLVCNHDGVMIFCEVNTNGIAVLVDTSARSNSGSKENEHVSTIEDALTITYKLGKAFLYLRGSQNHSFENISQCQCSFSIGYGGGRQYKLALSDKELECLMSQNSSDFLLNLFSSLLDQKPFSNVPKENSPLFQELQLATSLELLTITLADWLSDDHFNKRVDEMCSWIDRMEETVTGKRKIPLEARQYLKKIPESEGIQVYNAFIAGLGEPKRFALFKETVDFLAREEEDAEYKALYQIYRYFQEQYRLQKPWLNRPLPPFFRFVEMELMHEFPTYFPRIYREEGMTLYEMGELPNTEHKVVFLWEKKELAVLKWRTQEEIERETHLFQKIKDTPEVFGTVQMQGKTGILVKLLDGVNLENLQPSSDKEAASVIYSVFELLNSIHKSEGIWGHFNMRRFMVINDSFGYAKIALVSGKVDKAVPFEKKNLPLLPPSFIEGTKFPILSEFLNSIPLTPELDVYMVALGCYELAKRTMPLPPPTPCKEKYELFSQNLSRGIPEKVSLAYLSTDLKKWRLKTKWFPPLEEKKWLKWSERPLLECVNKYLLKALSQNPNERPKANDLSVAFLSLNCRI